MPNTRPVIKPNIQIKPYKDNTFRKNLLYNIDAPTFAPCTNLYLRTQIKDKISTVIENLDEFEYTYFTSGVTHALDMLLQMYTVQADGNEYRYIFIYQTVKTELPDSEFKYITYPSSYDGKFRKLPEDKKIILDCTYLFSSNLQHNPIIPKNVEFLLFGFGKSHNVADLRLGVIFSKKKLIGIHTLQYDYMYNDSIWKNFLNNIAPYPLNQLYLNTKDKLTEKYLEYGLTVNDTTLFAMNENNQRVPYYVLQNSSD